MLQAGIKQGPVYGPMQKTKWLSCLMTILILGGLQCDLCEFCTHGVL